ncbi:urease accessory protein UreH [Cohnella candidum]|uniref:Urease accessory protein UreH n=1 Tax=Cohnella candidum TaxID=2674991 RepID=A0A3G3K0P7_9BACL|nr:urease accessory protein UreH [Cohnella candidum]AYQ73982.1 urease accessory protein UreH [Cohnella candidum]
MELFGVLVWGLALGLKHALEPDHVIAVSTIAGQSKSLWRSSLAGVFWGIGHASTLLLTGILLIGLNVMLVGKWALSLEFAVGIMLVFLGSSSIVRFARGRGQAAQRPPQTASIYRKSTLIGVVHGMAGSGALVLLTMSTVKLWWEAVIYIAVFGAGTIGGMLVFSTLIGVPFALTRKSRKLSHALGIVSGGVSAVFGLYYMYNMGIKEGLFRMWLQ